MDKKVIGGLKEVASSYIWWAFSMFGILLYYKYIAPEDLKPDDKQFFSVAILGAILIGGTFRAFVGGYEKAEKAEK
jgi:hypothetical protein